jgi:hypothetical protein
MATLDQINVTVTTTPTLILTTRIGGSRVKIGNESGKIVYIGGPAVTKDNGLSIKANAIEPFDFSSSSEIYAVVATGTASVTLLEY